MLHNLDIANATHDEIHRAAYQRGHDIATWQDTPELGQSVRKDLDWVGVGTVEDANDQREALSMMANEAENNERQFSPNEVWISAVNARADADEVWQIIENAICEGIQDEIYSRGLLTYYVYADYGYQSEREIGVFSDYDAAVECAESEVENNPDANNEDWKIEVLTFSESGEVNTEYMP